jgi:membrane-bound acyltransferase YfiQ involved in biofilm formation
MLQLGKCVVCVCVCVCVCLISFFSNTVAPSGAVWVVYVYFAGIIAGTLLGIILQFCLFARGISWDQVRKHACPKNEKYSDELGTPLMDTGKKRGKY